MGNNNNKEISFLCSFYHHSRAETVRGHAEQEAERERRAENVRPVRDHWGVHGTEGRQRSEQGMCLRDIRH